MTIPTDLFALRYPDTKTNSCSTAPPAVPTDTATGQVSAAGRVRVRSGALASTPAVVVASEPMDDNPEWRSLTPGELLHVDRYLQVHCTIRLCISSLSTTWATTPHPRTNDDQTDPISPPEPPVPISPHRHPWG